MSLVDVAGDESMALNLMEPHDEVRQVAVVVAVTEN